MLAICCVSWTPSCLLCRIGLVEAWSGRPQDRAVLELIADTGKMISCELVEVNPALDQRNLTACVARDLLQSAFGASIL